MTLNVSGLGQVPYYQATRESTSDLVQNTYDTNMQAIAEIFNRPPPPQPFTAADYQKLQDAVNALQNLATKGDTSTAGGPFSCTELMLQKIGNVFTLLQSAGLTNPNPDVNAAIQDMQMLQQWKDKDPTHITPDGNPYTFKFIVTQATLGVSGSNLSLQSQVGTDFVIKGNQYYLEQLALLQQSMQTGVTVQQLLAQLQELRNANISVPPSNLPVKPTDPLANGWIADQKLRDAAVAQYQRDLAAYNTAIANINQPVPPTITHNADVGQKIIDVKTQLEAQIKFLTTAPPAGAGQDINNPASLAGQLQSVVTGINQAFGTTTPSGQLSPGQLDSGSNVWLLDGKNATVGAGTFGGQLAQAMAGSGSFNSTQRDNFNQTQKAADQIYTISASILQTLSDMIKKMADNAAR